MKTLTTKVGEYKYLQTEGNVESVLSFPKDLNRDSDWEIDQNDYIFCTTILDDEDYSNFEADRNYYAVFFLGFMEEAEAVRGHENLSKFITKNGFTKHFEDEEFWRKVAKGDIE